VSNVTSVDVSGSGPARPQTDPSVDFDTHPPVPVDAYERTVKSVNVGYELFLTLTHSALRAVGRSDLQVLVVGAGGGAEIEAVLPANRGWRLTGVDPSQDMLALARRRAEWLGVSDRVSLIRGTVEDLPADAAFDAATCLFVLHFLPDDDKRALLRGIARRLRPGGSLILATGARVAIAESLRADVLGIWQHYGQLAGMPAEQMRSTIDRLLEQQLTATAQADQVRLLHEAGFAHVGQLLSVFDGGLVAWIAR
jgi:tRNA (cmo5U34)-methyltransferase